MPYYETSYILVNLLANISGVMGISVFAAVLSSAELGGNFVIIYYLDILIDNL